MYALEANCNAVSLDSARSDGLFKYLEGLDGVPGSSGSIAEVTDVVQWCLDISEEATNGGGSDAAGAADAGVTSADGGSSSQETSTDSTEASGSGETTDGAEIPPQPSACGPSAMQRTAAHPTDNFGTWTGGYGIGIEDTTSYALAVQGGGIEYSVLPCHGSPTLECIRIDALSFTFMEPESLFELHLGLVDRTSLLFVSTAGEINVPAGELRFVSVYEWEGVRKRVEASNTTDAHLRIDTVNGEFELADVSATTKSGDLVAEFSSRGDLVNTQPRSQILVSQGSSWNKIVLTAQTTDAESDPVVHQWTVLGGGQWQGDSVELTLSEGRHAVVLFAEDVHRARGVTATWVEIGEGGLQ